jgi:hypothetical protein
MRRLACIAALLTGTPVIAANLTDDAYVCKTKAAALLVVGDPELARLNSDQLAQRLGERSDGLDERLPKLDADIARTRQTLDVDRAALKSAQTLEFQTGVRQNWRPTEQAVHDGEARLERLVADRNLLETERKRAKDLGDSCSAANAREKISVLRRNSSEKLVLIRVGNGTSAEQMWTPTRFLVAGKRSKKN